MGRERRRRKRKTSVLTARCGDVATTQAKGHDDGHPDGLECPLGRGQWSTCSSTPSRLIGSALCGCRMGRSRKLSPCDAISFQGGRLVWLLIDPLGLSMMERIDLITGPCRSLHLPHPSSRSNLATATYLHRHPLLVLMLSGPSPVQRSAVPAPRYSPPCSQRIFWSHQPGPSSPSHSWNVLLLGLHISLFPRCVFIDSPRLSSAFL
jgi:hypothetical protein